MRILVTGASGFVGRAVLERFSRIGGHELTGAVRRVASTPLAGVEYRAVADLDRTTDWAAALAGCDSVVHAAARVHVMHDTSADPLAEFRRVNVEGSVGLARQAIAAGVRRFLFVSSVKVNGEETASDRPFRADDAPAPRDPYGVSKLEAEEQLRELLGAAGVEYVIVRPTLVYGPGVKGNFRTMLQWLQRRVPLPLAAVHNLRSLTALDNLASLIERCLVHPSAPNQVFLAADGEDLSTPELLRKLGRAMGAPARLFAVPPRLLLAGAALVGRRDFARRLVGSLRVDVGKARELLEWSPVVTVDEGLERTARAFLAGAAA